MHWLNSACSRAVKNREAAHKQYRSHPSAETYALYISARKYAKSILQLTKNSFINRKCQNMSDSNSSHDFWHIANNISNNFTSSSFPPLLQPDGSTAVSSFSIAEQFVKPLLSTLFKMILGIFLLLLHPLTTSFIKFKFFIMTFPVFSKNCTSELILCLVKLLRLCLSTSTYPSCWKFAHIQPVS